MAEISVRGLSKVSVQTGTPNADGGLSKEQILKVVQSHASIGVPNDRMFDSALEGGAGARYVDCRWPGRRLTIELDGYRYHHSRHAWETDGPSNATVIGKSLPRGVDAGHGWPRDPLLVSDVENQIPVQPQAEHGGDAVRRVRLEVMLHGLT